MINYRIAQQQDARGILEIYAPFIQDTSITFETEVPTLESFQERIRNGLVNYPWLVAEIDGKIAGYAYCARHRERKAYQWCVESSVYIHPGFRRLGLARNLYALLFEILQIQGFHNIYAVINLPNDQSVKLHEKCGFSYFASYEKVGYKLGAWKNVGWWRLILNNFIDNPPDPLLFSELDRVHVDALLKKASSI